MPTVSVILPTHNRARFLTEAIDSVLAQTYHDWELVIVDDGSTDSTQEVVDRYAQQDPRISVIHQPNQGLARSRNNAIQSARGTCLAFLDDDDVWVPDKLKRQLGYLEAYPEIGLLFSRVYVTDEHLQTLHVYPQEWACSFEALLERMFWIPLSSVMVRRACLDEVGDFDEQLARSADYDLWLRIVQRVPFACLEEPLARYRQHANNMSAGPIGRRQAHLVTYRKLLSANPNGPVARHLRSRIARECYELGRSFRDKQEHQRAALHFLKSVTADPWVGWQLRRYHPRGLSLLSLIKPYLAIGVCFLRGLR